MILRNFIAAIIASAAVMESQRPSGAPTLPPPTDAEIVAALQGDDWNAKQIVIGKAAYLAPPSSLRPETIATVAKEIANVQREGEARFEAFQAGTGPMPTEEESKGEYLIQLASLLMRQLNPASAAGMAAGVDGLAEVVHLGLPLMKLVQFGGVAVPALVRVARENHRVFDSGKVRNAMEALEQMLESPQIRPTLSPSSRAAIRQLAADRMRTLQGDENWRNLAAAASLAVATGDPELRKEAADLIDNDAEFIRRGISVQSQQQVSELLRQALAKFRE